MNRNDWRAFLTGLASLMDWGGFLVRRTPYDDYATPAEADRAALASDWRAIGGDLWAAIDAETDGEKCLDQKVVGARTGPSRRG